MGPFLLVLSLLLSVEILEVFFFQLIQGLATIERPFFPHKLTLVTLVDQVKVNSEGPSILNEVDPIESQSESPMSELTVPEKYSSESDSNEGENHREIPQEGEISESTPGVDHGQEKSMSVRREKKESSESPTVLYDDLEFEVQIWESS